MSLHELKQPPSWLLIQANERYFYGSWSVLFFIFHPVHSAVWSFTFALAYFCPKMWSFVFRSCVLRSCIVYLSLDLVSYRYCGTFQHRLSMSDMVQSTYNARILLAFVVIVLFQNWTKCRMNAAKWQHFLHQVVLGSGEAIKRSWAAQVKIRL